VIVSRARGEGRMNVRGNPLLEVYSPYQDGTSVSLKNVRCWSTCRRKWSLPTEKGKKKVIKSQKRSDRVNFKRHGITLGIRQKTLFYH